MGRLYYAVAMQRGVKSHSHLPCTSIVHLK